MFWLLLFSGAGAWWFYDKLEWGERILNIPFLG
jgi:hypothetical protein